MHKKESQKNIRGILWENIKISKKEKIAEIQASTPKGQSTLKFQKSSAPEEYSTSKFSRPLILGGFIPCLIDLFTVSNTVHQS